MSSIFDPVDYNAIATKGGYPYANLNGNQPVGYRAYNTTHYDFFGEFEITAGGSVAEARLSLCKGFSGSGGDYYIWVGKGTLTGLTDPVTEISWHAVHTLWTMPNVSYFVRMTSPDIPQ